MDGRRELEAGTGYDGVEDWEMNGRVARGAELGEVDHDGDGDGHSLEAPSSDVLAGHGVLELRHLLWGRQSSHLVMAGVAVLHSICLSGLP